jgi:hypothetical protein
LSEYQKVIYFCLQFCRLFHKLLGEIDRENLEDMFDLLIVSALAEDAPETTKKAYIDEVDMGW